MAQGLKLYTKKQFLSQNC